jgi:hypothetical protein
MIVTPRYGNYIVTQVEVPKALTSSGILAAQEVAKHMQSKTRAAVDVVGVGTSCYDHLSAIKPGQVWAMNGANSAGDQRDASGLLGFVNARALWHWRVRELLDPSNGHDLAIPPDQELLREACSVRWKLGPRGVQVESKDEIKTRLGRSPDKWDSLVYSLNEPAAPGSGLLGFYKEESGNKPKDDDDRPGVLRIGSK